MTRSIPLLEEVVRARRTRIILTKARLVLVKPKICIWVFCKKYLLSANDWSPLAGVDFVQEKFMGQGPQDNESAVEQAKDEQISDFIRGKYKSSTGSDFPIKDKQTKFG